MVSVARCEASCVTHTEKHTCTVVPTPRNELEATCTGATKNSAKDATVTVHAQAERSGRRSQHVTSTPASRLGSPDPRVS